MYLNVRNFMRSSLSSLILKLLDSELNLFWMEYTFLNVGRNLAKNLMGGSYN
jgi:hypothetical protein